MLKSLGWTAFALLVFVFVMAVLIMDMFGFWVMGELMASSMWWFLGFVGANLLVLVIFVYCVLVWDPVKAALRRRMDLERRD